MLQIDHPVDLAPEEPSRAQIRPQRREIGEYSGRTLRHRCPLPHRFWTSNSLSVRRWHPHRKTTAIQI